MSADEKGMEVTLKAAIPKQSTGGGEQEINS